MPPTIEQTRKIDELLSKGYKWNQFKSTSAAGVVIEKGNDLWFFGLDGEIMQNPEGYSIKV